MEIQYIRVGDYYIPDLTLPEEPRPIGKWERHEFFSGRYPVRLFSGKVWKFREYWMYFPFIILKSESKRSARLP